VAAAVARSSSAVVHVAAPQPRPSIGTGVAR
jgi:hypothetical protein